MEDLMVIMILENYTVNVVVVVAVVLVAVVVVVVVVVHGDSRF